MHCGVGVFTSVLGIGIGSCCISCSGFFSYAFASFVRARDAGMQANEGSECVGLAR